MKRFVVFFCLFALLSCKESPVEVELSIDDQLREVAFRHQFPWYSSDTTLKFIFIANFIIDSSGIASSTSDPSDALLERFRSIQPPVKRYSEIDFRPGVFDKVTGKPGVLYRLSQPQWTSSSTVVFFGGDYFGPRGIDNFNFYLSKHSNTWVVDSTQWRGSA